jgi:ribosome biogenesis GTPase
VAPTELAGLLPDLAAHLGDCRFANCSHRHEPGCGVRAALARGEIVEQRMRLYEALHEELSAPPRY